jgi:hypothetical protein
VHEVEAVEGMRRVLDAPVHVHAAVAAGMALDGGGGVDRLQLVAVGGDRTLSRDTTATWENSDPAGFQHLVQPHTWLCATCPLISTTTGSVAHRQDKVPPAKTGAAGWMPSSTAG